MTEGATRKGPVSERRRRRRDGLSFLKMHNDVDQDEMGNPPLHCRENIFSLLFLFLSIFLFF